MNSDNPEACFGRDWYLLESREKRDNHVPEGSWGRDVCKMPHTLWHCCAHIFIVWKYGFEACSVPCMKWTKVSKTASCTIGWDLDLFLEGLIQDKNDGNSLSLENLHRNDAQGKDADSSNRRNLRNREEVRILVWGEMNDWFLRDWPHGQAALWQGGISPLSNTFFRSGRKVTCGLRLSGAGMLLWGSQNWRTMPVLPFLTLPQKYWVRKGNGSEIRGTKALPSFLIRVGFNLLSSPTGAETMTGSRVVKQMTCGHDWPVFFFCGSSIQ